MALTRLFSGPETSTPEQETQAPAMGGLGNAAVTGMLPSFGGLPGLGDLVPDLPGLGDLVPDLPGLGDLIPDIPLPTLPVPELPLPGLPSLPDFGLPDIGLPGIGLPQIPGLDTIQSGLDTAGQIWDEEGMGAIFDPVGALDRHNARQELASRFEVVGDDFVGPRNHNQVSAEEYERIVQTYSDIRLGRGDLTIDTSEMTDPEQERTYRQGTMDAIADMMQTTSGRNMIYSLSNNVMQDDSGNARQFIGDHDVTGTWLESFGSDRHRHTTIRALYNDTNNNDNLTDDAHGPGDYFNGNAFADATGAHGENGAIDTSGRNHWSRDASGNRGLGTDSTIWWNPTANAGGLNAADSDVILAHEMQHTLHETQGTMASGTYTGPGPDNNKYANFERQAVGLPYPGQNPNDPQVCPENTYRAERNQLGDNFLNRDNYDTLPGRAP